MKTRLTAILAMIGLIFSTIVGVSAPASAESSSTDATLSSLWVGSGAWQRDASLSPGFEPQRTWYSYASTRQTNTLTAWANDADATIHLKYNSVDKVITSGVGEEITLPIAVTEVTVSVIAGDGVTKKDYLINFQIGVLLQPQILSVSPNVGGDLGGEHIVIRLKNALPYSWSNGVSCYLNFSTFYPDGSSGYMWGNFVSIDNQGISEYAVQVRTNWGDSWYQGKVSLKVENYCDSRDDATYGSWRGMRAFTIKKDAYEYKQVALDTPVLPAAQMTQTGRFTLTGFGINNGADIWGFMYDPAKPGTWQYFWTWGWAGNTTATMVFDSAPYDKDWNYNFDDWKVAGKKSMVILKCGTNYEGPKGCWKNNDGENPSDIADLQKQGNILWSGQVDYRPDVPTQITLSPSKGSIAGGNKIRIRGHHLSDQINGYPVIKIGGQEVTSLNRISDEDWYEPNSMEVYEGVVPASVQSGAVPVTITNHMGTTTASVKYTYSAKPEITSIAPASVANSGGSLVTITGKNFGVSGTPAVTIDGIKSPCVTRVSDTKVVAMVPASTTVGKVDVNMISGAGGGSPDLPASMTLAAPGTLPTASKFAPSAVSIGGGDEIVITGTNFGAAGTVGVMVGANCARVTASTSTSITIEAPSGDAAGAADVTIGTTTGTVVKVAAVTYNPTPGVSKVLPSSIPSYATGNDAKVEITGNGFGTGGKIKVGAGAAVNYVATDGGTKISGVVVPTNVGGVISIAITPTGATTPFTTSVKVRAPKPTYFGPDPYNSNFDWSTGFREWKFAAPLSADVAGGKALRIQGTDFGPAGSIKVGTTEATVTSWSDSEILFTAPAKAAATYDVVITPTGGVAYTLTSMLTYTQDNQLGPKILKVAATVDNGRVEAAHTFDPGVDKSDVFEITGSGFLGTDSGASTKVYLDDGSGEVAVTTFDVAANTMKIHATRGFSPLRWVTIHIKTNVGDFFQDRGLLYVGDVPAPITFGPNYGLCSKDAIGTSPNEYRPTTIYLNGPDSNFGETGTVTIGGVTVPASAVTWSSTSVTVDFGSITGNWTTLWGNQNVVFTPTDTSLIPRTYSFFCGVSTNVVTKLNGSTSDLTINAGTAYTASAEFANPLPGINYTAAATGYEYVKAADYAQWGFSRNVNSGLPVAAGEYYIRVAIWSGTYDTNKYTNLYWENGSVHLTINGTPVTFTPKLVSGSGNEITYNGPITDGTDGSTANITYTKTATADPVTFVVWEYRDHACTDPNWGWYQGLPQGVAIQPQNCGGDGISTVSSWDIRVKSFDMISNGVNRNIYYLPTYEIFNLKINKKGLTISKITAEKPYDGNTSIGLSEITVTGAVNNETPQLDSYISRGEFADANVGSGKAITLSGTLALASGFRNNYFLTNPDIVFTGTIKKADAILRLTSSVPSVIMTNATPFEVTATVRDVRTNQEPIVEAGIAPVVITSASPSVCSITGTTVTPIKAGDCVIKASQAASVNYNASKSYSDDSTVETITVKIFASPKALQIVADDMVVAQGDSISPTAQVIGLIDGDSLNTVEFDYYQGTTLLTGAPTEPGTYKVMPRDANLQAADAAAYQPDFKYVGGKLVITQVPPVLTQMSPSHGPEAGGATITITGERLGDVTSISWGSTTIRKPNFTVNGDGTEITFKVPAGTGQVDVVLRAGTAEVQTSYVYDAPVVPPVTAPTSLRLKLELEVGAKLSGQTVDIQGGGLKANSTYTLELHSTTVIIYTAQTDANGDFKQTVKLPAKSCVEAGTHYFKLTGTKPDGKVASDMAYFQLGEKCVVGQGMAVKTVVKDKITWTLSGFLFKYRDDTLTADGKKSLKALFKLIKDAKVVKISGFTETDTKDPKVKKANLILAKARCLQAQKYLESLGLKAKFTLYGKGGVNPVSLTDQSKNRRVVIDANF